LLGNIPYLIARCLTGRRQNLLGIFYAAVEAQVFGAPGGSGGIVGSQRFRPEKEEEEEEEDNDDDAARIWT